jgi:hypothetical protein
MQVWTILDMHDPNICSSFHWHFCNLRSTQAEEKRMGLWHKFGDLVCWIVLWLCHYCPSWIVCNPQILLRSIWPCSAVLSLWLLPICLYSCSGKFLVVLWTMNYDYELFLTRKTPGLKRDLFRKTHWKRSQAWQW